MSILNCVGGVSDADDSSECCDVCHQAVVSWTQVNTILGMMDLCGTCYWRYRDLMDELAAFVNAEQSALP